jgi:hypothetical protein
LPFSGQDLVKLTRPVAHPESFAKLRAPILPSRSQSTKSTFANVATIDFSSGSRRLFLRSTHRTHALAFANAPGLRRDQLRGIVCNRLPLHANLLFSCASRAAAEGRRFRLASKSRRMAMMA